MQFLPTLTVLSLSTFALAIPSLSPRTDGSICNNVDSASIQCCNTPQNLPITNLLGNIPLLTSLLPILSFLEIPLSASIPVALACSPIIGVSVSTCSKTPTCCITSQPSGTQSTGLISLLDNNQVNLCSPITA